MLSSVPITVSQAITLCNAVFSEMSFQIEGEVAGFNVNRGMYVFFDLKDEEADARLSCFMMAHSLTIPLEDGMRVVVTGRPGIHTKSGKFSITVQRIEPKGEGSVKRAFELLKKKLESEGLFDIQRKRQLPRFPQRIGVISSADAAGYGDFMRIAESRLKGVEYIFAHCAVQGREAEEEICFAFDHLNSQYQLDVIVLVRGGGSMEDLHAFNSEPVARAIVRSKTPVVVGVGHERDVTIADFCADVRAATPSNAAQLVLPTTEEVITLTESLVQDGHRRVESRVTALRERSISSVYAIHERLGFIIKTKRQAVESLVRTITAISPEETLRRGYSITWQEDGTLLRTPAQAVAGSALTTQLAEGTVHSVIS